jgi:hypothetical protein
MPKKSLSTRLREQAAHHQDWADNAQAVVEALSEQMRRFEARDGSHNVYAVRMAVDHKSGAKRDAQIAADLREAADLIDKMEKRDG